ncbi:hypothetical protein NUW58_g5259 [Xylaria curta]|uniref:Uncharacterized protein n=1 Tax=Xylaria curta TaxID=42375 RepID=A0ACC1P2G8_9PEZI|nr:hypothetical protein NUW58_g5259 [Xylaria curta]
MAATILANRDEVARMNPHLSDNNIDNLIELGIPELTFDYGGAIRMNAEQQDAALANGVLVKDEIVEALDMQAGWTPFTNKPKGRIYKRNRLSTVDDYNVIRGRVTPKDYWQSILEPYPPQQGYKINSLVGELALIAPNQQPSESKIYATVKARLEAICQQRETNNLIIWTRIMYVSNCA